MVIVLVLEGCVDQPTGSLPIVLWPKNCNNNLNIIKYIVSILLKGYRSYLGEEPSYEQIRAWNGSLTALLDELVGLKYPVIIEYPIFGGLDRIDFIVVGTGRAIIVEAKGWRNIKPRSRLHVIADGKVKVNPCYQVSSYHAKMVFLHSSSKILRYEPIVYLYNLNSKNIPFNLDCEIVFRGGLRKIVETLPLGGNIESYINAIVKGRLELANNLILYLDKALRGSLREAITQLVSKGYGLAGMQAEIVADILYDLETGKSNLFYLIEGTSGSGKTLIAITAFLEAISRGYTALLGYVNNRLVNVLRYILSSVLGNEGRALSKLVGYSALGVKRYTGFCEPKHNYDKYGGQIDLLIVDEAQRLPNRAVESCPSRPARVIVAFYDSQQILLGREAGTGENLKKSAISAGRQVKEYVLPQPARVPVDYLRFVRSLLWDNGFSSSSIEVKIFSNIIDIMDMLRERYNEDSSIALICAFTESEGDRENKLSWSSIKNIRIGYPLQSGFNLYKNLNIKIKWLMDEKSEYPLYWRQDYTGLARLYGIEDFDPVSVCSSVYGAQGMEAEYVGIVWGRDLVWRNGKWTVNPDPITDNVGGRNSLKSIARRNPRIALELLRNRYYIMLTRATRGVYLFFEDEETKRHIEKLIV